MRRDAILERARILSKLILTDANYYLLSIHLSHPSSAAADEGWGTRLHFPPGFTFHPASLSTRLHFPPGFTFHPASLFYESILRSGNFFRRSVHGYSNIPAT